MTTYRPPRSKCQVCGGPCSDRGIFRYQGIWLHTFDEDWVDNPHDAVPDPKDVPLPAWAHGVDTNPDDVPIEKGTT